MDLFSELVNSNENLLPYEGEVYYYGPVLTHNEANRYYRELLNHIAWENDVAVLFGKRIVTKRKVAWYADQAFGYSYSNNKKIALPWTTSLLELKTLVESKTDAIFNSCLLNLYHSGAEGMAWHSDAEKDLKKHGAIGSLSLGAERKFSFKHKKTKETKSIVLDHGSLLVMKGTTQDNWLHRLPPTTKISEPRINLTFRMIDSSNPQRG